MNSKYSSGVKANEQVILQQLRLAVWKSVFAIRFCQKLWQPGRRMYTILLYTGGVARL